MSRNVFVADSTEEARRLVVIAGDPPTVTQQINDLRARIGDFGTLVLVADDWDDKQRWARSLELFGSEVMPALTA